MRVSVDFQDERLELDFPGDSLIGSWSGPAGMSSASAAQAFVQALEHPLDFPPFRQIVVPGDRVAIALDPMVPELGTLLGVVLENLARCDVDIGAMTIVTPPDDRQAEQRGLPANVAHEPHDPGDSASLAYLATTENGRRIYLNRRLVDADVVIPISRLGHDPVLGYRGPWSLLFPSLGDHAAQSDYRQKLAVGPRRKIPSREGLQEAFEVGWLLGSQFQVGLIPGATGVSSCLAGLSTAVREQGIRQVKELWSFHPPTRAECVVVGIGAPGEENNLFDLVEGLVTAARVVQHGGRIVALSRAKGRPGPSIQRLLDAGDPKHMAAALRGHEDDPDSVPGHQLADVLGWADVFLLSELGRQTTEDLFMIPLDHAEDARRLIRRSGSCLVIGRAEWTHATAGDEPEAGPDPTSWS